MNDLWRRCLARLEAEFSAEDVHTYLAPLQARESDAGLTLWAPNAYTLRDRARQLSAADQARARSSRRTTASRCNLQVGAAANGAERARRAHAAQRARRPSAARPSRISIRTTRSRTSSKASRTSSARPRRCRSRRIPGRAYNPLLLYGGTGLGKTHLMHAAGNLMRAHKPDVNVMYLRSEQFVSGMVQRAAAEGHGRLQAALPLGRCAADRRHPILRRQEHDAGRVLPHVQRADRGQAADHPDLRSLSEGSRQPRAAAEIAARLGPVASRSSRRISRRARRSCWPRRRRRASICPRTSPC